MPCETLANLVDVLDCDELELLAQRCNVRVEEFYFPSPQEADLFNEQLSISVQ
jgi:hypothetical protein